MSEETQPSAQPSVDTGFVNFESRAPMKPYENTVKDNSQKLEPDLYRTYVTQYLENPFCSALVDYLVDELAGDYELVLGPSGSDTDLEAVEEFFYLNGTRQQLKELTLQAVLLGNGFGQRDMKGDKIAEWDENKPFDAVFRRVDAETIAIERDAKGKEVFTQTVAGTSQKLKRENLMVMRLKRYPNTPYGVSFLRSSINTVEAMNELVRDVPAAIKNFAYNHRLAKLNLAGYDTAEQKKKAIQDFTKSFNRVDPASNGVIAIDATHDLGFMANVGGQGGNQSRMMPIMDFIEPLISFTMLNFLMALGHIQQTGANKAILEVQEQKAKERLESLQKEWSRVVDLELLQFIVGGPRKVQIIHRESNLEQRSDREVALLEFQAGLISKEYHNSKFGIVDDGTTFATQPGAAEEADVGLKTAQAEAVPEQTKIAKQAAKSKPKAGGSK